MGVFVGCYMRYAEQFGFKYDTNSWKKGEISKNSCSPWVNNCFVRVLIFRFDLRTSLSSIAEQCGVPTSPGRGLDIALWVKPLRNWEFKDWPKMMTSAPIFLKLIFSDQSIWMHVSLSIYIWVRVENSQIQQYNYQRTSCNSCRLLEGCE